MAVVLFIREFIYGKVLEVLIFMFGFIVTKVYPLNAKNTDLKSSYMEIDISGNRPKITFSLDFQNNSHYKIFINVVEIEFFTNQVYKLSTLVWKPVARKGKINLIFTEYCETSLSEYLKTNSINNLHLNLKFFIEYDNEKTVLEFGSPALTELKRF